MKTPQQALAIAVKTGLNLGLVFGFAIWSLSPLAQAESQIYGTMDLALNGVSHQGAVVGLSKTQTNDAALLSGGLSPSRLGFKGQEPWGGGWSAVFTLESGFNAANGKAPNGRITVSDLPSAPQEGKLFGRELTLGLKNAIWGEVRLGLQANPMATALAQFDVNSGFMDPLALTAATPAVVHFGVALGKFNQIHAGTESAPQSLCDVPSTRHGHRSASLCGGGLFGFEPCPSRLNWRSGQRCAAAPHGKFCRLFDRSICQHQDAGWVGIVGRYARFDAQRGMGADQGVGAIARPFHDRRVHERLERRGRIGQQQL